MSDLSGPESSQTYLALLNQSGYFDALSPETLKEIETELAIITVSAEQTLFDQHEMGDSMYIVDRGLLEAVTIDASGASRVIDRLGPGDSVGEMALITARPRSASIIAVIDSRLVRLSKAGFDHIIARHPAVLDGFLQSITPRVQRSQLTGILGRLFNGLDAAALHDLQSRLHWIHLNSGEPLFRQGDAGQSMYILVNGRLQVVAEPDAEEDPRAQPHVLAEAVAGETIGEFSLLTDEPRSASVYAMRDCDLVEMTRPVFEALVEHHPRSMVEIARLIATRQQRSLRRSGDEPTGALTMAIIPAGGGASLADFAGELARHLSALGPVRVFTRQSFDDAYGRDGAAELEPDDPLSMVVSGWLREVESQYRFILFVADNDWSTWTQRCLGQADRVIAVANAWESPSPNRIEQSLGNHLRRELVLLHPSQTQRPSGTPAWLRPRGSVIHHHIRVADSAHWQRLVRRLTDTTVGLVLSGGGARGLAHVGVIRAIEEAGQPVDMIAGTSMGALVAALLAIDTTDEGFMQIARRFSNPAEILDQTVPLVALNTSKKMTGICKSIYGDAMIEDLWRPYFCVATNLSFSQPTIIDRGPLWRSVRASAALPGVFTPILSDDDELLVDGALMNNFPVDLMRERCPHGTVIGCNVSPYREQASSVRFGESVSGWRVLASRLNPFATPLRVPSVGATIMRSMEINSLYRRKQSAHMVDVLIEPEVAQYGILEYGAYEPVIQAGYAAAAAVFASTTVKP